MKQLLQQRASIFVPAIPYTEISVRDFPFKDWSCGGLKSVLPGQPIDPFKVINKDYDGGSWNAVSKGNVYCIVFLQDKIDIISNNLSVSETEFLAEVTEIIKPLAHAYGFDKISRVAYAPTYGTTDFEISSLLPGGKYKETIPEEFSQSYVFRVNENICDKLIKINNVVNIGTGLYENNGNMLPALIYQLDINSMPGEGPFDLDTALFFYHKASKFNSTLTEYLKI